MQSIDCNIRLNLFGFFAKFSERWQDWLNGKPFRYNLFSWTKTFKQNFNTIHSYELTLKKQLRKIVMQQQKSHGFEKHALFSPL